MARGVNKVILIGNIGQEIEVKYMPSGGAVTNVSIATSETWKDKTTGQPVEKTEWHRVVFFNRLGEIAGEYLKKGSKVYVEGSLRTRKWQAQDGTDRYTTEIVASELQMLDGKPADAPARNAPAPQAAPQARPQPNAYAQASGGTARPQAPRAAPPQPTSPQEYDENFEDIPF